MQMNGIHVRASAGEIAGELRPLTLYPEYLLSIVRVNL
jgi:hypothetical protein